MRNATIKNLLAHKLRLALTAISVVLGVAFVAGTLVLTDTMNATFDNVFGEATKNTSVAVRAESAFSTDDGTDQRENIAASLLRNVEEVDGVAEATPIVNGYAQVVGKDGDVVQNGQAPGLGTNWIDSKTLSPLKLTDGRAPAGPDEVAIDGATAEKGGLAVGDRVKVLLKGPARTVELTGIFNYGDSNNLAGATMTAFETEFAQEVLTEPGKISAISLAAADGVSDEALLKRVREELPSGIEAITGAQLAKESADTIQNALSFFTYFLLTFAIIALFVGSFIIFNTFTMLVAQRTKELALLRAVGASRKQVTRSVMLEALLVGLIGSIVGLALGFAVALGLLKLMNTTGAGLPEGDLVFAQSTVIWAFVVGVGVTVVAAVLPARRAAKIPPVAALREGFTMPAASLRRRLIVGSIFTALGVISMATGLFGGADQPVLFVGAGAMAIFIGVATLSPLVSQPLVRLLALPLPRLFKTPGRLSRENALRNPRRTSATASALMIGLALVGAFSVMGASLKASFGEAIDNSIGADFVLGTEQYAPLSTDAAKQVEKVDGVAEVGSIRWGTAKFGEGDGQDWISAVQPYVLDRLMTLEMIDGDARATLEDGELLVSKMVADNEGWKVGQEVSAEYAATGKDKITVGGIFEANPMAGDYLISTATYDANYSNKLDSAIMLTLEDGADVAAVRASLEKTMAVSFPNVEVMDQTEFKANQQGFVDTILALVTALLALAILIAVFGIVNTLALSVFERTHEIGLLRAVGMSRRQLRRMIRLESVIISVFGAVLGLALGTAFGWAIVTALKDLGVSVLSIPFAQLGIYLVVAGFVGVLAAVWPARRAAKLNVLQAIATD